MKKDKWDPVVSLDPLVRLVGEAEEESGVHLVRLDLVESLAHLVVEACLDLMDLLVPRVILETEVHPDLWVLKENRETLVDLELLECKVLGAHLEEVDPLASGVHLVCGENQELMERMEKLDLKV